LLQPGGHVHMIAGSHIDVLQTIPVAMLVVVVSIAAAGGSQDGARPPRRDDRR